MSVAFSTTWLLVTMKPFAFSTKPDPAARVGRRGPSSKKRLKKSSNERSSGRPLSSGLACASALSLVLTFTTAGFACLLRRTQSGAWIMTLGTPACCSVHSGARDAPVKPRCGRSPTRAATAAAGAALDLEGAAVGEDDRACDGQTEAAPARVTAPAGVEPHEGLEDAPGVGGIDSDSGVLDDQRHAPARSLQRDHHASAGRRVLDRVVNEVQQCAPEGAGITLHHRRHRRAHADIDALAFGEADAQ